MTGSAELTPGAQLVEVVPERRYLAFLSEPPDNDTGPGRTRTPFSGRDDGLAPFVEDRAHRCRGGDLPGSP